jgi:CheY-like chemotaxis protein
VEDEVAILNITREMLTDLGYTTLVASTPSEAVRIVQYSAGELQLLITDVVMPEMTGRELAERLRAMRPTLACLFTSGYTANVIAHHGVLDEGVRFLQKPYTREELAHTVREVLDA